MYKAGRQLTRLVILLLILLPGWLPAEPPAVSEYALKSALLYKLPRYVYLQGDEEPVQYRVCVLGENPFGRALERLAETPLDGRKVQVRQIDGADEAQRCHFMFIARSEQDRLARILRQAGGFPAVTVSDIEGFARVGGMVEFALNGGVDSSLAILINRKAAEQQGIRFNAQLLRLARLVE